MAKHKPHEQPDPDPPGFDLPADPPGGHLTGDRPPDSAPEGPDPRDPLKGPVRATEAADTRRLAALEREQADLRAESEKGVRQRTQEACDRAFPEGAHKFWCELQDGNGHPRILVAADNATDAAGRYLSVCGVRSSEKPVAVDRA